MFASTDSEYSLLAWTNTSRKDGGLGPVNIPLLSDKNHSLSKDYGVLIEEEGVALRGLFLIDPQGIVRQVRLRLPARDAKTETNLDVQPDHGQRPPRRPQRRRGPPLDRRLPIHREVRRSVSCKLARWPGRHEGDVVGLQELHNKESRWRCHHDEWFCAFDQHQADCKQPLIGCCSRKHRRWRLERREEGRHVDAHTYTVKNRGHGVVSTERKRDVHLQRVFWSGNPLRFREGRDR